MKFSAGLGRARIQFPCNFATSAAYAQGLAMIMLLQRSLRENCSMPLGVRRGHAGGDCAVATTGWALALSTLCCGVALGIGGEVASGLDVWVISANVLQPLWLLRRRPSRVHLFHGHGTVLPDRRRHRNEFAPCERAHAPCKSSVLPN